MAGALLVTGFEPFGDYQRNPSSEVLAHCPSHLVGWPVCTAVLPVSYRAAARQLATLLEWNDWAAVLMLGLAGSSTAWRIETVARNRNGDLPDNDGLALPGEAVLAGESDTLPTALPALAIRETLRVRGIAAELSEDAGGYLCNFMFFRLMAWSRQRSPHFVGGFVHMPPLSEDADGLASLERHVAGLHGVLQAVAGYLPASRQGVG